MRKISYLSVYILRLIILGNPYINTKDTDDFWGFSLVSIKIIGWRIE